MSTLDNLADTNDPGIAPNAKRLLWAGFMAILAAGVGFALRGGIFDNWAKEFGFTGAQLGAIGGAGFSGFCFGIIIGGVIVDKIGYGKLVALALICHVLSAFVTFGATNPGNAYNMLFWGMFIFAFANGTLEAVANPLVATLFPQNRTHYLNILHASWPAGMILGVVAGWILDDKMQLHWKLQLALYLVPTVLYGIMFMGQKFPQSEAAAKGASFSEMFKAVGLLGAAVACFLLSKFFADIFKGTGSGDMIGYIIGGVLLLGVGFITQFSIGSILLFVLFVTHALVGAVELGTDGWIQNITGNLFTSEQGKYLFLWTSAIMFGLRFCAHFIERTLKLSPVGLLFVCAVTACIGLNLASGMHTFGMALIALGIYAVGKTFFWPTMLAVVGDRYPQTGAVAMSIMGGIGMLSAGLIGGPGLGYCKDRFAGEELKAKDAALFEEYKAAQPSKFLNIDSTAALGLDGKKLGEANDRLGAIRREIETAKGDLGTAFDKLDAKDRAVIEASITGDRKTLKTDSWIPATMAVIYLLLFFYFKAIGGYKAVHIAEDFTGGTRGPMQA
ncbi:MAG: MFS transporter [Chthoniobacteraceae bacterium]